MCQLLETIRVSNNSLVNIQYHTDRVNHTRYSLLGKSDKWDLSTRIKVPILRQDVDYRCRLIYSDKVENIGFLPYTRREISKLYVTDCGTLDYSYKYADRRKLELLRNIPDADISDILIVKNGFITDTSYANIVFFDGIAWYTPSTPLLRGTKRQNYLDNKVIFEKEIRISDLRLYEKARIINAMINLEESNDISVENIFI